MLKFVLVLFVLLFSRSAYAASCSVHKFYPQYIVNLGILQLAAETCVIRSREDCRQQADDGGSNLYGFLGEFDGFISSGVEHVQCGCNDVSYSDCASTPQPPPTPPVFLPLTTVNYCNTGDSDIRFGFAFWNIPSGVWSTLGHRLVGPDECHEIPVPMSSYYDGDIYPMYAGPYEPTETYEELGGGMFCINSDVAAPEPWMINSADTTPCNNTDQYRSGSRKPIKMTPNTRNEIRFGVHG